MILIKIQKGKREKKKATYNIESKLYSIRPLAHNLSKILHSERVDKLMFD